MVGYRRHRIGNTKPANSAVHCLPAGDGPGQRVTGSSFDQDLARLILEFFPIDPEEF
jgi:hypothetical protein